MSFVWTLLCMASVLAAPPTAQDNPDDPKQKNRFPAPDPYLQAHVWATLYDGDTDRTADPAGYGDPEDDPGFKIRRGRVGFTGQNEEWLYAVIVGQSAPFDGLAAVNTPRIDVVDAHAGWSPVDNLWLVAGVQKVPVSRELIMSSQRLALVERSAASEWLIPGRDTGFLANYQIGSETMYGRLSAGVFNGNRSLITDDNLGKLLAVRAEFVSGDANPYYTFGVVEGVTFAIAADFWRDDDVATDTLGAGVDLMLRAGAVSFTAEARVADLAPDDTTINEPAVLAPIRQIGALAQIGYTIGSFEPAARFSLFDDDTDLDDNGDVGDVLVGITYGDRSARNRIGGGFVHRIEFQGAQTNNDTLRLWWLLRI
ncbi:MAG: porin [Myxococcota bacterium]